MIRLVCCSKASLKLLLRSRVLLPVGSYHLIWFKNAHVFGQSLLFSQVATSKDTSRDLLGHLVKSYATPITRWSGVAPRPKPDGYLVFILPVVFFTDADELPILSDLDLDLLVSRLLYALRSGGEAQVQPAPKKDIGFARPFRAGADAEVR